nr:hypothetical protein [Tanacetum cinerariifolium]
AVVTSHAVSASFILVPEMKTKTASLVCHFIFHDSSSAGTMRLDVAGSSHLPGKELSMGSQEINSENLHEFYVGTAPQACLNAEVRMRTAYCLSERKRLESECEKQADLLKARDEEIENLKAHLLLKEAKAAKAAYLRVQVSAIEAAY